MPQDARLEPALDDQVLRSEIYRSPGCPTLAHGLNPLPSAHLRLVQEGSCFIADNRGVPAEQPALMLTIVAPSCDSPSLHCQKYPLQ